MTGQVTGPAQIDFSGTLDAAAAVPRATLTAELARLDIGAAATPHHIGPVQLALDGTPHALRLELHGPLALHDMAARAAGVTVELVHEPATAVVTGEFTWQLEGPADDALGTLAGTGSVRYADAVLALRHVSATPYPTTLSAEVHDLTADPRLTATLTVDR